MNPRLPDDLMAVFAALDDVESLRLLLSDLLTPAEKKVLSERWAIVKGLAAGLSQREVRDTVGVSISTVSRGSRQLSYGHGGFAVAFECLAGMGLTDPRATDGGGEKA